jgi:hypothetical protein
VLAGLIFPKIREIEVLSDKEPARALGSLPDIVVQLPAEAFKPDRIGIMQQIAA